MVPLRKTLRSETENAMNYTNHTTMGELETILSKNLLQFPENDPLNKIYETFQSLLPPSNLLFIYFSRNLSEQPTLSNCF